MMKTYHAIGLMSGTSLDGLDISYVSFTKDAKSWGFQFIKSQTLSYSPEWEDKLRNSINISPAELLELNVEYGFYLGNKVQKFIAENKIHEIDVISSHGHTVFHQPQKKITLQIGDGRAIKIITGIPTVYDFRSQDILMGGNGAPLVPIGDDWLFSGYDACINIGGFSNISFKKSNQRIAFDICPVNIVLNTLAESFGKKYDENGTLARKGKLIPSLLEQLDGLSFYQVKPPRSLGIEWIHENVNPLLKSENPQDLLATCTEHFANQISLVINNYGLKKVLMTGGGAYNCFLIEKIKEKTKAEIIIPASEVIEYKEALIFAFMGLLRILGKSNVLSSATGSSADHSSGIIA